MASPRELLKRYWGYDTFRPAQAEIIDSVLAGNDTLGLLPTGGGKSITFQVPALALPGLALVVTPLISLMKDQVDNLLSVGVRAVCLHSGLSRREARLALDRCRLGKVKLAYISPEKLNSETFMSSLRLMDVSLIVVDEAHCISQWGYDFRPSYLKIARLREIFPDAPLLALTASATPEVVADIRDKLRFRPGHKLFQRSFSRDNLSYIVRYADSKETKLLEVLRATAGSAIVYVRSRKRTRLIAEMLADNGISADYYHAGLAPEDKNERQNRWKSGAMRVMVATNAFGMGIDKPDVRVVVHIDLPPSLEEYYQEAGRAGRDGEPAFAVTIASKSDKALLSRRVTEAFPPKDFIRRVYELAGNFLNIAVGSGFDHTYDFNFTLFCAQFDLAPLPARNALMLLTRAGYLEFSEEPASSARVMVLMDKYELYDLHVDPVSDSVLQALLRTYTGLFSDYQPISEPLLAMRLNLSADDVYQSLLTLTRIHAIHYIPRRMTPFIHYTTSREEPRYVQLPLEVYERRREAMERRIEAMKHYVFDTDRCRVSALLRYFGEEPAGDCGKCDVCRTRRSHARRAEADIEQSVLYLASQPGGHTVGHICRQTGAPRDAVIATIRRLADEGRVTLAGMTVSTPAPPRS